MKAPAFQFYADDFYAGSADMSQAEAGAYIRLLCAQWGRGGLPVELEKLERLAGGPVSSEVLKKFKPGPDGLLRNKRLEDERLKQETFRKERAESGRKGADSRWRTQTNGSKPPMAQPLPEPPIGGIGGKTVTETETETEGHVGAIGKTMAEPYRWPDEMAEPEAEPSTPLKVRKATVNDELFEVLARVTGNSKPEGGQWPSAFGSSTGKALADLRKFKPDLTGSDLEQLASNYRAANPDWSLTPSALAKHASSVWKGVPARTKKQRPAL